MTDESFALLVEGYLRGTLSPEERRALTDLLADPERERLFQDQVRLHIRLAAKFGGGVESAVRARAEAVFGADSETRKLRVLKSLENELDLPASDVPRRKSSRRRVRRSPPGTSSWIAFAAAGAAIVLIALAVKPSSPVPPRPAPGPTAKAEEPPGVPAPAPQTERRELPPAPERTAPPAPPPVENKIPVPERPVETPPAPPPTPAKPPPPEPEKPSPAPTVVAALAEFDAVQGEVAVLRAGIRLPARVGLGLQAGDGLECVGRAVVRFPDSTQLDLAPGAVVRSLAESRVTLERGTLTAEVAKQAAGRPLRFFTPHAEATVLGTTLRLVVEAGSTRLDVDEGKVRLTRLSDRKSVEVPSGHFAVAAAGLELAVRPMPVDEILLTAGRAKIAGKEWRLVKDDQATSGEALEASGDLNRTFPNKSKGKGTLREIPSVAIFSFHADAGKEYRLWIRTRCLASADRTAHDSFAIDPGDAVFETPCPWFGPVGDNAYLVDHVSKQDGYWWVGGNERDPKLRTSLRFTRAGMQTLKLYVFEGPLRIDAIWLSVAQKDRPAAASRGPGAR